MKRSALLITLLLICGIAFAAEPINIGVIVTSTGPSGYLGESEIKGAEAIAAKINKAGGINGSPINLITYNDEGKEEKAVLGWQKLVKQSGVKAVLGPGLTGPSDAVAKLNKTGPLAVSASGGFIPEADSYMFSAGGSVTGDVLHYLFSKWFKEKGYKRIALLAAQYASGEEYVKYAEKYSKEYPGYTLTVERFKLTDVDVVSQLTRIKSQNPQILIVSAVGKATVMVTKNFNQLGMTMPIFYSGSNASRSFLELLGTDRPATPMLFPVFAMHIWRDLPDKHPQKAVCREFDELYKSVHKEEMKEPFFTGVGADALMVIVSAIKGAGTDPVKMRAYLENFSYIGTSSMYKWSKQNHLGSDMSSVFVGTAKGNDFKLAQ
jgi:branched-chain amino acid transport system substrate-binding protein